MSTLDRRRLLIAMAGCLSALRASQTPLIAQESDGDSNQARMITPKTRRGLRQGLEFLASRQSQRGDFGTDGYRANVAVISLAGMAFMADGSTPGRGNFGRQVSLALDYVLRHVQSSGYVIATRNTSHGPMYGHGFSTLFLAEAYGMTHHGHVREKLSQAVKLIIDSQNEDGGWRYEPQSREADISVTICQVMALRAARNAGLFVANDVIERCNDYVKRCQNPDGGFSYQLPNRESAFPRSAAGVVALNSAGIYEGEEIRRGLEYLMQFLPGQQQLPMDNYFYYGHYYAVQAMWQAGGEYWKRWYPAIRDQLLSRQRSDGSWFDQQICAEYATAMACLILQMPNNFLPIFQR
jgi:hypothetical protein